jgi:CIC family chloride channel protein
MAELNKTSNPKSVYNKISKMVHNALDRTRLSEHTFVILLAVIIGLIGGYGAVVIQYAIHGFQKLFWGGDFNLTTIRNIAWYWKLLIPLMGGIVVGMVIRYWAKEAKGHGVPEVMEAITLRNGIIRPRVVLAKLFASSFYIAAGGSVGREGPVIQIGSAVGSTVGQFFKVNPARMRTLVACGAASGIAGAFNAPIAGALFAVEIILGDFAVAQISPIVIASVVSTVVSRYYLGDYPAFLIPSYSLESPLELLNYVVLGFLAGAVAVAFIKTLYYSEDFFDKLKLSDPVKGAIGGILIGCIGIFYPEIFGVGYDALDSALKSNMIWRIGFILLFLKIIATSISLGSGGSGGIFAPSLFMGAMLGAFFGGVVNIFFPAWTAGPGAYALVAMGGVVGAATHGPIAAILIIFELSNDYNIILPLMITTIIATLFAQRLNKESIYTLKLVRRGINIFEGREINVLKSLKVGDVAKKSIELVGEHERFNAILDKMVNTTHNYIYTTNNKSELTGSISMYEIRQTLLDYDSLKDLLIASDIANPGVVIVNENDSLDYVMKQFGKIGADELPVVSDRNGKTEIVGTIFQQDVIEAYNHQVFLRDMTGEVKQSMQNLKIKKSVHVVDQYHFSEIEAPMPFVGKTLQEINLRNQYDLELLLLKRPDKLKPNHPSHIHPGGNTKIHMGDILLVFGTQNKINILSRL